MWLLQLWRRSCLSNSISPRNALLVPRSAEIDSLFDERQEIPSVVAKVRIRLVVPFRHDSVISAGASASFFRRSKQAFCEIPACETAR